MISQVKDALGKLLVKGMLLGSIHMHLVLKSYSSSAQRSKLPRQRVFRYHSLTGSNTKRKFAMTTIGKLTAQSLAKIVILSMFVLRDLINLTSLVKHLSLVIIVFLILKLQPNVKIGFNGSTPSKKLTLTRVRTTPTGIDKTYTALTMIKHLEPFGIQTAIVLMRLFKHARQTLIVQETTCA